MGGEGSMMAANQSLKANRAQLKRDRAFKGLFSNSIEKPEYNLQKWSKEKLKKLRLRLQQEQKIRQTKIIVFVSFCLS